MSTNEAKIYDTKRKRGRPKGKGPIGRKPIGRQGIPNNNQTPDTLTRLSPEATLGGVARGTGLDMTFLSRVFGERRSASIQTMQKIAAYLGVTVDALLTELGRAKEK